MQDIITICNASTHIFAIYCRHNFFLYIINELKAKQTSNFAFKAENSAADITRVLLFLLQLHKIKVIKT